MNKIGLFCFFKNDKTFFNLFSKSPLYLVPAIRAAMSSAYTVVSFIMSGTLPVVISFAIPSAIAVLPTPDSPTSNGLFLVLLDRI